MGIFNIFREKKRTNEEKAWDEAHKIAMKVAKGLSDLDIQKINSDESLPDNMHNIKNSKELYFRSQALHFRMKGDFYESIKFCNSAIKINPNSAYNYLLRAESKRDLGLDEEAFQDINKSIKIDPTYADAYTQRGNIRMTSEVERLKSINNLKALDFPYKEEYKSTGKVFRDSLKDFEKAISLDPNDKEAIKGKNKIKKAFGIK